MRVAITHTRYIDKGGVERYAWDLVRRLCDRGHEVHFFCHFTDDRTDPRVVVHKIPNSWKQIRFMKVWSFDRWLTRHVRRADWDVVHGFSKSSVQDVYTDGSGCLLDYQAYSIDEAGKGALGRALKRNSLHQRQVLAVEERRFTRGNFAKIVTMSELAAEQIRRRYGLTDQEVVTIFNGIDTARFHPRLREEVGPAQRAAAGVEPDAFVVLCVANDYRRKGVPTLIEAARRVAAAGGLPGGRPLRVVVIGKERASTVAEYEALARSKGVGEVVRLLGPQDAVERWHALADLHALPSRFDAFGNVVLEAMATGVPPLVSKRAGAHEVVEEGVTGWKLEDPDDAATVAATILACAGDEARRRAVGAAARRAAEALSWDVHFERMLALYEEVAAAKRAAGVRP